MANLKAGTLIGGNLIWSAGNLPLRTQGNNIYINDSQIYSEFYKPTPAVIGAVNKSGDTMTGNLAITHDNDASLWINGGTNKDTQLYLTEDNKNHGAYMRYAGAASDNKTYFGTRQGGVEKHFMEVPRFGGVNFPITPTASSAPTASGHLTRRDYVDAQVATKVALAGSTMTGKLTLNYTSSVKVPVGTSAQRGSGVTGDFRFNSDEKSYEGFDGTEWQPIGSGRVAYTRHTANFTGVKGKGHLVDTTKAGIVATLPSGMKESDFVVIGDGAGNASKNPFYVAGYNGDRIVVNSDNCMLLFSWVSGKWVITNGIGESGAIDTANYVRKAGDTFTGDMKFNPGTKLRFVTSDFASGSELYARPAGDGFGANLYMFAGGNLVLGSGESARNLESLTTSEHLYLTSDGNIELISGGNAWADRKSAMISSNGDMSLNRTSTAARFYLGNSNKTYIARSGANLYLAANEDNGKVYVESKTNPVARVNGTDYEIYHKGNKPTAGDIGALSSNGGTVSGVISISEASTTSRQFEAKQGTVTGLFRLSDGAAIFGTQDGANWTGAIKVGKSDFVYTPNASTWYKVYHQGFKPTAADVGAFPITGGNLNGDLTLSTTSTDARDIIWLVNGVEKGRLWLNDHGGNENSLVWRKDASGLARKIYHEGFKPSAADIGAAQVVSNKLVVPAGLNSGVGATVKNQKTSGVNESWLTSRPDTDSGHKGIGVNETDGPVYWDGSKRKIYHEGYVPAYNLVSPAKSKAVPDFTVVANTWTDIPGCTTADLCSLMGTAPWMFACVVRFRSSVGGLGQYDTRMSFTSPVYNAVTNSSDAHEIPVAIQSHATAGATLKLRWKFYGRDSHNSTPRLQIYSSLAGTVPVDIIVKPIM